MHVFHLLLSSKMDQTTPPTCHSLCLYWQTVPPNHHKEFIQCCKWFLLTLRDYLPLSRRRHGCNGLSNKDDDNDNNDEDDEDIDVDHHDNTDDDYANDDEGKDDNDNMDHHDHTDDDNSEDDNDDKEDDNNDEGNDNDDDNDNNNNDDDDDDDDDDNDDVSLYSVSTVGLEVLCRYIQHNGHILVPSHENDSNQWRR